MLNIPSLLTFHSFCDLALLDGGKQYEKQTKRGNRSLFDLRHVLISHDIILGMDRDTHTHLVW
jgi:hypothetical protein